MQTQTVSELKDFVKKLNSLPEMTVSFFLTMQAYAESCSTVLVYNFFLSIQRHINLAQHLTTFTSKQLFLGKLDMEQTLVEAQSYDMYAINLSISFPLFFFSIGIFTDVCKIFFSLL